MNLMCVELAKSPSGVSRMVRIMLKFWDQCGSLGLWLLQYIPRHTALPRTITYQEAVVESYTNLRETYRCTSALTSGAVLQRNRFTCNDTQIEGAPKAVQYC